MGETRTFIITESRGSNGTGPLKPEDWDGLVFAKPVIGKDECAIHHENRHDNRYSLFPNYPFGLYRTLRPRSRAADTAQ
jgi:hypothetical protein